MVAPVHSSLFRSINLSICLSTVAVDLSLWILLSCSQQNTQQNINTGLFICDMASLFWCRAHPLILSPGWRGLWTALGQWGHLTCRIFDPHKLPLWERPSHMERRGERDKWIDRRQMTPKTEWMEKSQHWVDQWQNTYRRNIFWLLIDFSFNSLMT